MSVLMEIGAKKLTLEQVYRVATGRDKVTLAETSKKRISKSRETVEKIVRRSDSPNYGINTGFGSLKNVQIDKGKLKELQLNLVRSHAVGVGQCLSKEVVRAMMLLRAHTLALGFSGVRVQVVDQLLQMLHFDIVPRIPSQGSVGASGDLAPLAHLALAMIGEGVVEWKREVVSSRKALQACKVPILNPEAKEALALLNGTQMMTSVGLLALLKAERLLKFADVAAAMTLEATLGSPRAYDPRVHALRPHAGQLETAENLRRLTAHSEIARSHADCDRVQDAYSIRCTPQVHGAAREALKYVRSILETEVNSVTDNPLVFTEEDEVISAGNFHGQPVAIAMDTLALALSSTASVSERRIARLLNPTLSELPPGLIKEGGLHSGMMMLQVTAASLVNECKTLSHPSSVDSIPTWADQEDHVSMGAFGARKAAMVVDLLEKVVSIELLCSAQALEFRKPLRPAKAVGAAHKMIRREVKVLEEDRYLMEDVRKIEELLRNQELLDEVEKVTGDLK